MEPVTFIIATLAAGAASVLNETGKLAIKDAYEGLRGLIKKRFADKNINEGEMVLKRHEEKPDTWKEPLKELLMEAEVANSQEILAAAQKLMEVVKPQQTQIGKFNIQAQNIDSVTQADKIDSLTQNFGTSPDDK